MMIAFLALLIFLLIAALSLGQMLRDRARLQRDSAKLVALISAHRHAEALQLLEALPRRFRNVGAARLQRGSAQLALWQPREAKSNLEAVFRRPKLSERPLRVIALPDLALACALLDARAEAQPLLDAAPKDPKIVLSRAIFAARDGRFEDVRTELARREAYQLVGVHRALSEVLLAWSEAQLEGAATQQINPVMLWSEGGPDQLRECWPELLVAIDRLGAAQRPWQHGAGA